MAISAQIEQLFRELCSEKDASDIEAGLARVSEILAETNVDQKAIEDLLRAEATSTFLRTELSKDSTRATEFGPDLAKAACVILAEIYPTRRFDGDGILQSLSLDEERQARVHMEEHGYLVMPHRLRKTECERIVEALQDIDFRVKATGEIVKGYHADKVEEIGGNTCWIFDQQEALKIPEVQQLASDPSILNLVQDYLGCTPIHDQVNCWWTINHKTSSKSLNSDAQLFHQDKAYVRFVKVFVYLNDVTLENGAHTYISGSAEDYEDNVPANYKVGQRVDDAFLETQYDEDRFVPMVGDQGTIVLEDTSGFHKGTPVQHGHRLLIQFEYCCSLYSGPDLCFSYDGVTPEFAKLAEDHPRFLMNYDNERHQKSVKNKRKQNTSGAMQLKMAIRKVGKYFSQIPQNLGLKKSA